LRTSSRERFRSRSNTRASSSEPYKSEGQYQAAGIIEREIGGVHKQHRFIRADAFASYDDAVTFTLGKARQIVDLQGERMFG
jgi:hypothetical protein